MLMCISRFPWENQLFLFFTVLWSALWKTEEYDYLLIIHLWCERSANPCPWCSCTFCYSNIPSHFGLVCSLNFFMVQSVFVWVDRNLLRDWASLILGDFKCPGWTVIDSVFFQYIRHFVVLLALNWNQCFFSLRENIVDLLCLILLFLIKPLVDRVIRKVTFRKWFVIFTLFFHLLVKCAEVKMGTFWC